MLIVFFDVRGIVHFEFIPQEKTVNSAFNLQAFKRLKRRVARLRADIKDTVRVHHNNALSHTVFIFTNFLAHSNTPVVIRPHYSPDPALCDIFLFFRREENPKGKHWEFMKNIQKHVITFLSYISVEKFQGAFQTRFCKCIDAEGECFEEF